MWAGPAPRFPLAGRRAPPSQLFPARQRFSSSPPRRGIFSACWSCPAPVMLLLLPASPGIPASRLPAPASAAGSGTLVTLPAPHSSRRLSGQEGSTFRGCSPRNGKHYSCFESELSDFRRVCPSRSHSRCISPAADCPFATPKPCTALLVFTDRRSPEGARIYRRSKDRPQMGDSPAGKRHSVCRSPAGTGGKTSGSHQHSAHDT